MLELRPNCECCDKDLSPASTEAMICSYECTFCSDCVNTILHNVCPNCGGGFYSRPIRPVVERRVGVSVFNDPPSNKRKNTKYTKEELAAFCSQFKDIRPENR